VSKLLEEFETQCWEPQGVGGGEFDHEKFARLILGEVHWALQELRCEDQSEWDRALLCARQLVEIRFETQITVSVPKQD
jgi:hypothetical protein